MDRTTAWMILSSVERKVVYVQDSNGWSAGLLVNHQTPSGQDRWLLAVSDNRRFATESEARDAWEKDSAPYIEEVLEVVKTEGSIEK